MFIISKILPYFILPPGIFIVLLFIVLFLLRKKRQVSAGRLTAAVIILLYFISIEPPGDLLIKYLENIYQPIDIKINHEAEYIVILGGGVVENSPENGGKGSLGSESLQRLLHGYYLSRRYKVPVITSGGRVLKGKDSEAESEVAMRELVKLGSNRKRIYQDSLSRNTFEQAVNIKKKFSAKSVILVTSAYHMPRSVYSFRACSIKVVPAPTGYIGNRYGYSFFSFLPRADNLLKFYKGCKEMIGFVYYAVRY
jgi:uncharacterized SAM-binding protein YcdF (DUF218 family)